MVTQWGLVVTIGKIIINAVKLFSYRPEQALYESKALEIFKLLNLNSRQNTQLKLMLNINLTNYYCLNLKRYRCILKINMKINDIGGRFVKNQSREHT